MGGAPDVGAPAAHVERAFRDRFGHAPEGVAEAPGRVNLIGEHLDYNEGLVLPVAIDRRVRVAFARRDEAEVRAYAADFADEARFSLDGAIAREAERPWSNYLRGVVWALREEGCTGCGLDLAVAGDVPIDAGLSSSAALEVAALGALRAAWGLELDGRRLALLAQRAEHEFAGVQCGIMDQLSAVFGATDCALLIDCRSLACEPVPLPLAARGLCLAVVHSGVPRRLEASAYNRRREECAEALRLLQQALPQRALRALRDVTRADLDGAALPAVLRKRVRHVVTELARVEESVRALGAGDLEAFGRLMAASHESLRGDFEVSCPELDRLAELARAVRGVLGARLTGAGFGGCTVNLLRSDALDAFRAQAVERYRHETGLAAELYLCRASDGLRVRVPETG
jgi:galactokinase